MSIDYQGTSFFVSSTFTDVVLIGRILCKESSGCMKFPIMIRRPQTRFLVAQRSLRRKLPIDGLWTQQLKQSETLSATKIAQQVY